MPANALWLPWLLAALSAIGPFSIDTYLPAFPRIGADLEATAIQVQQTLSAYMLGLAGMVLWHGALADRYGRRRVLLVLTAVFALASILCAAAPSIEWLWLGRVLQGVCGGAGVVVGRAVVRDVHEGAQAQRLMARVMLIFALAPAIAPLVGAALLALAGWRSIFIFLAVFGIALTLATWRLLPETLPVAQRQSLHPAQLLRGYRAVFGSPAFVLLGLTAALNFCGFFLYVMSAPVFILEHLGLGTTGFIWLFGPAVGGMMLGSLLSERMAGVWRPGRTVGAGFALMFAAVLANLLVSAGLPGAERWIVLAVGLYCCGMSIATPTLNILALDLFPARRGMASSCQSFMQIGINALLAGVVAPLLWTSTLSLATGMALFVGLGVSCWLLWMWRRRQATL